MPKLTVQEQLTSTNKYPKIPGITWEWGRRKWKVQIRFQNRNQFFGRYANFYEAYYTLCIAKDILEHFGTLKCITLGHYTDYTLCIAKDIYG